MRLASLVFLFSLFFTGCTPTVRLYFVRHAEKSYSPAGDPDLTEAGRQRAEALSRILKRHEIGAIYSTDTRRTRQTAAPLSEATGVPVRLYSQDTVQRFLYTLMDAECNALVVGHSNTVLGMIRSLGLEPSKKEIGDQEYDNLFLVTMKPKSGLGGYDLNLKERTYGKKSVSGGATGSTMQR
jgi:phosphohistidine phosphatase SixA